MKVDYINHKWEISILKIVSRPKAIINHKHDKYTRRVEPDANRSY